MRYGLIHVTDDKIRSSCYAIFREYGSKIRKDIFNMEMKDRLGFSPLRELDENSDVFKSQLASDTDDVMLFRVDEEFIYGSHVPRRPSPAPRTMHQELLFTIPETRKRP